MKITDIHHAKAHLAKLAVRAAKGQAFVLEGSSKAAPAKVTAVARDNAPRRMGFFEGSILVPDDFDTLGEAEIEALFGLRPRLNRELR